MHGFKLGDVVVPIDHRADYGKGAIIEFLMDEDELQEALSLGAFLKPIRVQFNGKDSHFMPSELKHCNAKILKKRLGF